LIAVIADTHIRRGKHRLPAACRRLLDEAVLIVHAGDFTSLEVLEELEAIAPTVAVHGNMDEPGLSRRLPARAVAEAEGLSIGVVHDGGPAAGRHERLAGWFPDCAIVVYGHSHLPETARYGDTWIVNPGSPTERRRAPAHTMAVVREGIPEVIEIGERV
jgi:putative phosphoesterase